MQLNPKKFYWEYGDESVVASEDLMGEEKNPEYIHSHKDTRYIRHYKYHQVSKHGKGE